MRSAGKCSDLIVLYGSVADKDVDAVLELMPHDAIYIFTQVHGKRALSAEKILEKFVASGCKAREVSVVADVADAVARAKDMAAGLSDNPLIYIGGSTYVVSEAIAAIQCKAN